MSTSKKKPARSSDEGAEMTPPVAGAGTIVSAAMECFTLEPVWCDGRHFRCPVGTRRLLVVGWRVCGDGTALPITADPRLAPRLSKGRVFANGEMHADECEWHCELAIPLEQVR
jgi:hypothetical protein